MEDNAINQEIIQKYVETVNISITSIKKILDGTGNKEIVNDRLKKIVELSSADLISKWQNKNKILRTNYIYQLIPNYPIEILELSITIDAMVNLLDDIYDETLTKEQKAIIVIELLRLIPFVTKSHSEKIRLKISEYFNKILTVAITESIYRDLIEGTNDFKEKLKYGIDCYNCKSKDIDLFIELPLLKLGINEKSIRNMIKIFNIHRALSIIFKDLKDINHDYQNQTYTPIMLLAETEKDLNYLNHIINYYNESLNNLIEENDPFIKTIYENVRKDIQNLSKNIQN
jgi:hypothetical protein